MPDDEEDEMAVWHRIDERTEQIDDRLGRMGGRMVTIEDNIDKQDKRIDEIDKRSSRNQTILNAITFGISTTIAAILSKLGGLFNFKF
ncbi:hypothetical protein [Halocatena halophila]|uniref:hypothetical protein n=1 Tax=Halocatena halophila TaxID=2814576 RepID=UPI002ED4C83D